MTQVFQKNKKVLLGLSGGVDSTAATLLLQKQGYEVIGLFFDVLGNQIVAKEKAEKTANELGIDFIYNDVSELFGTSVIDYFCNSYLCGETPNPCVMCNPTIKFKTMIDEANRIGAYYLATGHYAQVYYDENLNKYFIKQSENSRKDQSYMMYRLDQDVLSRLILPLGTIDDKEMTRDLVREKGIHNADTKDSQEICFIKEEHYINYIKNRQKQTSNTLIWTNKSGKFIDKDGKILGEHQGIVNYTIGQRKGLGITFGKPVFVTKIDKHNNTVTLGSNEDLFTQTVLSKMNIFTISARDYNQLPKEYEGKKVTAKIRYAAKPADATLYQHDDKVVAKFKDPQRAVTPGQSIVFYDGDIVIGGGIICD